MRAVRFSTVAAALLLVASAPTVASPVQVVPMTSASHLAPLPVKIGGRAALDSAKTSTFKRQWPGTYFETGFSGTEAAFNVGPGDVILDVLVDGALAAKLTKPAPGLYAVKGVGPGTHNLRVEVVSELSLIHI